MWQKWNNRKCYWSSLRLQSSQGATISAAFFTLVKESVEWGIDGFLVWRSVSHFLRNLPDQFARWKRFNLRNAHFSLASHFKSKTLLILFFFSLYSLQLQRTCQTMSFQFGVVQAFWPCFGWSLCGLSTRHHRSTLPLLQRRIQPRPNQTDHPQKGMQTWVVRTCFTRCFRFKNV